MLENFKIKINSVITKEMKSYLFFGVLTTIVNYSVFAFGIALVGEGEALWINMIAFICAVIFAFITNKIYVFKNKTVSFYQVLSEFGQFVFARLFSMGFEQVGLFVCIEWINVSQYSIMGLSGLMISKVVLSFVSVLLNYIASKFIIFKENPEGEL